MLLQDKICLITGAASERGIGRACAHLFVEHGATVVLLDLDGEAVARTAQTLGPTHLSFELDVSDRAACREVIARVLKLVPRIDCLINNAGIAGPTGLIETLDPEALTERVDSLLNEFVLPFAQVRQVLVDRLGMEKGAETLVIVAFGERLLNRVWTAAADGHLPEARACFPEAYDAFVEARTTVREATAT